MAMVHPSRMGLVPQDPPTRPPRSPSPPPRTSKRRSRSRSVDSRRDRDRDEYGRDKGGERDRDRRDRERDRDGDRRDRDRERERDDERRSGHGDRSRRHDRDRARADDYFNDDRSKDKDTDKDRSRKRSRSRSVDRERDRERDERRERERDGGRGRRTSPEYEDYRRPLPGRGREDERDGRENGSAAGKAPWRQQENMYPARGGRGHGGGGYGGGGADFLESRRQQREASTITVWPPSPKAPTRVDSPTRDSKRHKKSHKRRRDSDSDTDSDDSEEERRRRERKERKKARKEKKDRERDRDREKDRHHRHRSRSGRYSDDEDDSDRERRRHRSSRSKSERRSASRRSVTRTKSPEQRPPSTPDEDEWVEKPVAGMVTSFSQPAQGGSASMPPPPVPSHAAGKGKAPADDEESDDEEVGPKPLVAQTSSRSKVDERQYGGALLRGEGSAMAAFLKDGTDERIPRRGEIGLSSDEIAAYESVGYVMSGSRHRRMNAVRMRKENQVISAEEKRGILKLQQEERERREAILREEFQQLVQEKLKSQGGTK